MKKLISLNPLLRNTALRVQYNNKSVAYSYGDIDALMKWIEVLNKKQIEQVLGLNNATKYPLIWLVEGWRGQIVVSGIEYTNVVFHISVNSNVQDLNETREPRFDILYDIAENFIDELKASGVKVLNTGYTERANFSAQRESHTIDIWDTLILDTELLINTNCLKKLYGA